MHNVDCIDECDIITEKDGLYSIYHILLPTKEWLEYVLSTSPESLDMYSSVYYYDEAASSIMEYINGITKSVNIEEILEINDLADVPITEKTTIRIINSSRPSGDHFSESAMQLSRNIPIKGRLKIIAYTLGY